MLLCLALGVAWWALLSFSLPLGGTQAPPLGDFLSPYTGFYRNNAVDYYDDLDHLPGLRAPVDVVYDERLVPHIYASSPGDLYYAQGFVQAQHRLFQFDLTARSADGRLSEVIGERTLELDRERVRIGSRRAADVIDSLWRADPKAYEVVERYAAGVNAYIAQLEPHEYPIEYKLLGFAPESWSPRKTGLTALSMAFVLNTHNRNIAATITRDALGQDAYDALFPERFRGDRPVLPKGTQWLGRDTALIRARERSELQRAVPRVYESALSDAGSALPPQPPAGVGSNNWAVKGRRTRSGHALLANDPHLPLTLPSIWFEVELHTGGLHVHGVNLPGVPGVVIGFNEEAAWGVTNVGVGVLDYRALEYTNPSETRYRLPDGTTAELTYRVERIGVRGAEDVLDTVAVSAYGPLVYTDADDARAGLAMDWLTVREPSDETIQAFLGLNRAASLRDFVQASYRLEWPAQNMVFANRDDDIALRVSGKLPRRVGAAEKFVGVAGPRAATGTLRPEENPIAVNPPQGYLASTNQVSTDASYPYYYYGNFEQTRSRRINELLGKPAKVGLEEMKAYQLDDYFVTAAELTPRLLEFVDRAGLGQASLGQLALLQQWDYRYTADAVEAVLFERWLAALSRLTWDELAAAEGDRTILRPKYHRLSELVREDPLSPWFDVQATPERETARELVTRAFREVTDEVAALEGSDEPVWAAYNEPRIEHIARIGAFSRTDLPVGGRAGALNAQSGSMGPSWRMVVELGDEVRAEVVYPGGQSGRPGHPHYDDYVGAWAAGEYYPVRLRKTADDAEALVGAERITLNPGER